MNPTDKCRRLADAIVSWFRMGITIDGRTERYIDTCLPAMSMEKMACSICDTPDLDTASLMDLILFPDENLQAYLEPLIETEMYDPDDEVSTIALLEADTIKTTLRGPEGRHEAPIQIPSSSFSTFVRRLNISRHIPPGPLSAIDERHSMQSAIRLKVMLRNAKFELSGPASDFVEAFLLGMEPEADGFYDCFELVLGLLGELGSEKDPFALLRMKLDVLHEAANTARRFDEQLLRNNMETLMHQGIRPPAASASESHKNISLLDRIGKAAAMGNCEIKRRETK